MHRSDVAVGWICALPLENAASQAALDSMEPDTVLSGSSIFTLGIIGGHRVVIGCLPDGEYGTAAAANVANDMSRAFPSISINLVVGIAGGAPFLPERDIRLGDVVVSSCSGENGAVFQYDYGKAIQNQAFLNTRFLNQPPLLLREAVAQVRTKYERNGHQLNKDIEFILSNIGESRKKFYRRPHQESDRLYHSDIDHSVHCSGTVCSAEAEHWIEREPRIDHTDDPIIHYGLIASANQLVKDALLRDKLASERNVLCFEMESAGLMNHSPCLVIRGICDYSDSHKNKRWQRYAAVTAAAYARLLLRQIPPAEARAVQQSTPGPRFQNPRINPPEKNNNGPLPEEGTASLHNTRHNLPHGNEESLRIEITNIVSKEIREAVKQNGAMSSTSMETREVLRDEIRRIVREEVERALSPLKEVLSWHSTTPRQGVDSEDHQRTSADVVSPLDTPLEPQTRDLSAHHRPGTSSDLTPEEELDTQMEEDSSEAFIRLWDTTTGEQRHKFDRSGLSEPISFSEDSTLMLVLESLRLNVGSVAHIWNTVTGICHSTIKLPPQLLTVALHPNGQTLYAITAKHGIQIWRSATGELIHTSGSVGALWPATFSPDAELVAVSSTGWRGSKKYAIKIWDLNQLDRQITAESGYPVAAIAISHNSPKLVAVTEGVQSSHPKSGRIVKVWNSKSSSWSKVFKHSGKVTHAAISPDSATLATVSRDNGPAGNTPNVWFAVALWDTATGESKHIAERHFTQDYIVTFSPDSKMLMGRVCHGCSNAPLRVWCVVTGKCLFSFEGTGGGYLSAAFSYDSRILALCPRDPSSSAGAELLDVATRTTRLRLALKRDRYAFMSCLFSHNSKLLATTDVRFLRKKD